MLTLCLFSAVLLPASDLDGIWEIQSLGADRTVRIETDGNSLAIHRVMHPEFEGSRYRLDHLYRGTLEGESIRGQLLVKDEELPDFEVLRSFEGSFSGGKLVISRTGRNSGKPGNGNGDGSNSADKLSMDTKCHGEGPFCDTNP
ncbi:MAG: hypothetical protein AAFY60_17555, partial [Myxococcota bacterium]